MLTNSIEQYLSELKKELSGCDRATIQDALSDAEEYLRTALNGVTEADPGVPVSEALVDIIARYGSPQEIAAAYKELESRTSPALGRTATAEIKTALPPLPPPPPAAPAVPDNRNFFAKFFGVFTEARTWGAFFYLILAMFLGIAYFTWAVTGLSLSFGLIILIVGLPILFLFLLSVRGVALLEGRLVEALLGVRMPRRPLFSRRDISWWQKMKNLFSERHTWTALIYMVLQLPLGIVYFSVFITLISVSIWFVLKPVSELVFGAPTFIIGDYGYFTPAWAMPLVVIGGVLLLTATMHLFKYVGKAHGAWAKIMLVRE